MKYIFLVFCICILAGCQSQKSVNSDSVSPLAEPTTKQGDSTLSGKIVQAGERFLLVDSTGKQTEIDSYKIEFTDYVNKEVSVTGQYSGDTLFVAEVGEK